MLGKPPSDEPEPAGLEADQQRSGSPTQPAPFDVPPAVPAALVPTCPGCGAPNPDHAGHCPGCGRFTEFSTESTVHGLRSKKLAKVVDAYRVDLIEQLFAERGGRGALTVTGRIAIENYALVCAQHKTIEARLDQDGLFTKTGRRRSAFDMLKGISETIDRLRAELPPAITRPTPADEDYENLTEDQLIARLELLLATTRKFRDDEQQRAVALAAEKALPSIDLGAPSNQPIRATTVDEPKAPEPEPACAYGCGPLARCAEIKATRPDVWETLHGLDPEVIRKKDEAATATMMKMLRTRSPFL